LLSETIYFWGDTPTVPDGFNYRVNFSDLLDFIAQVSDSLE
jgi:hypothetical protein